MPDVTPDPKPAAAVKNPDLLRALKVIWCAAGCACCGATAPLDAELGWSIELHHLDKRGRPDEADKIIGLCGAFLSGCHNAAEAHQIRFTVDYPPLAWCDSRLGGGVWQPVRYPYDEIASLTGKGGVVTSTGPVLSGEIVAGDPHLLPPAPTVGEEHPVFKHLDVELRPVTPEIVNAEKRFVAIRELVVVSEQNRLLIALNLYAAFQGEEHTRLNLSWPEYLNAVGVSRSAATKMLTAVSTLTPARLQAGIDRYDRELSLERVYQAARGAAAGVFPIGEALEIAATRPVHDIVALLKGESPERQTCVCPTCGAVHAKRGGFE